MVLPELFVLLVQLWRTRDSTFKQQRLTACDNCSDTFLGLFSKNGTQTGSKKKWTFYWESEPCNPARTECMHYAKNNSTVFYVGNDFAKPRFCWVTQPSPLQQRNSWTPLIFPQQHQWQPCEWAGEGDGMQTWEQIGLEKAILSQTVLHSQPCKQRSVFGQDTDFEENCN